MDKLSNLLFILPVMGYYAIEALIVGLFIWFIWNLIFLQSFGNIPYIQFVGGYWIIKMLLFDVFKLITGLGSVVNKNEIIK